MMLRNFQIQVKIQLTQFNAETANTDAIASKLSIKIKDTRIKMWTFIMILHDVNLGRVFVFL